MSRYLEVLNSSSDKTLKVYSIQFYSQANFDFEEDKKKYGFIDPRADKAVDHKYWEDILWNAWHFSRTLYYILHGIRCGGGGLTLTKNSFKLLPGEWSEREWEEIKQKYLGPIKDQLIWILKLTRAGKVTEETLPEDLFKEKPVVKQNSLFG